MTGKLKYRLFAFLTGLVIAAGAAGISASAEDNGEMRLRVLLRRLNIGQHMEIKQLMHYGVKTAHLYHMVHVH